MQEEMFIGKMVKRVTAKNQKKFKKSKKLLA